MENLPRNIEKKLAAPPRFTFTPPKFSKRPKYRTFFLVDEQGEMKTVSGFKFQLFRGLLVVALLIAGFLFFLFLQEDENHKYFNNIFRDRGNREKSPEIKTKRKTTEPAAAMANSVSENHLATEPEKREQSKEKRDAASPDSLNLKKNTGSKVSLKEESEVPLKVEQPESPVEKPPEKPFEFLAEKTEVKREEAPVEKLPEKIIELPAKKPTVKTESPAEKPAAKHPEPPEKVKPAQTKPGPRVDVESLKFSYHKPNTLTVRFDVKNTVRNRERVAGHTILVLKTNTRRYRWIALPEVMLKSGRPSGEEKGDVFNIYKFKSVRLTTEIPITPNRLKTATVFIFDPEGVLLLEKTFPISEIVQ